MKHQTMVSLHSSVKFGENGERHNWQLAARSARLRSSLLLFPCLLLLLTASCFASKSEFLKLQDDITAARITDVMADSAQRSQLAEVSRSLRVLSDSISALNRRVNAMRSISEGQLASIREDISQLQDLSGQGEQKLREMRATIEGKSTAPAVDSSTSSGTPTVSGPGPAQLLQAGRDQLLKGGNAAARSAFNELLVRYPNSELAPEAVFYTAQSFAAERKVGAADSVYVALIARFPNSPRIPTAMYKRAQQMQAAGQTSQARQLYSDIIRRFPRSDEAALAEERLQSIR